MSGRVGAAVLAGVTALALSACQSATRPPSPRLEPDNRAAIAQLQKVNDAAQSCWMKSGDAAFRAYRVIPELDTRTGRPRILIMKAGAAQGLPQLVIEASGNPVRMTSYGPLAAQPIAARITTDVMAWSGGRTTCS